MAKILNIFDFDGTLFRSPLDCLQNHEKFEKETGIPWLVDKELSKILSAKHQKHVSIRRGWFGRPETLEPPLVADPAPPEWFIKETVDSFLKSKLDNDIVTVIMTGRHVGLKNQVLRILRDGNLVHIEKIISKTGEISYKNVDPNVQIYFLGMDGPIPGTKNKPSETFPWKIWISEQLISVYSTDIVEIWEDRKEHVVKFQEEVLANQVIVNFVT